MRHFVDIPSPKNYCWFMWDFPLQNSLLLCGFRKNFPSKNIKKDVFFVEKQLIAITLFFDNKIVFSWKKKHEFLSQTKNSQFRIFKFVFICFSPLPHSVLLNTTHFGIGSFSSEAKAEGLGGARNSVAQKTKMIKKKIRQLHDEHHQFCTCQTIHCLI
jgi:hypothetical protein